MSKLTCTCENPDLVILGQIPPPWGAVSPLGLPGNPVGMKTIVRCQGCGDQTEVAGLVELDDL